MDIEAFRDYCLSFKAVTESFPFDESTLVFKVEGKMFALTNIDEFESVNLKCDPEISIELREKYTSVSPGYHMNKKHWITVQTKSNIPDVLIENWIQNSYNLVVSKLPKSTRQKLLNK